MSRRLASRLSDLSDSIGEATGVRAADVMQIVVRQRLADAAVVLACFIIGFLVVVRSVLARMLFGTYPSDGTRASYFAQEYVFASLAEWRLPLWNPFVQFGTPLGGNIQWAVFSPLNLLFVALPTDLGYNLFIAFYLGFGGASMYLLTRYWGLRPTAAAIAALAYLLNGRLVAHAWGGTTNMLSAAVWMPLAVLVFERALEARRYSAAPWLFAASGVMALGILSGHPQETFFVAVAVTAFAVWHAWRELHNEEGGSFVQPIARWAVMMAGAAAIAAVQLIPTYEAGRLSTRAVKWSVEWPATVLGSYNPVRLLTWLVPDLFGNTVSLRPASTDWLSLVLHEVHSNEFRAYIGVLPVLLVVYSLPLSRRTLRVRFLWILTGISVVLALGHFTPVYGFVSAVIPPLQSFRIAARFMSLTVFAAAVLAGFGAERLMAGAGAEARRWSRGVAVIALTMAGAVLAGTLVRPLVLEVGQRLAAPVFDSRPSGEGLTGDARGELIRGAYDLALRSTGVSALLLMLGATVFLCAAERRCRRRLPVALISVTLIDLAIHTVPYTGFVDMSALMEQHEPLVSVLRAAGGNERVVAVPAVRMRASRDLVAPSENALVYRRLPTAGGYDPLELATYHSVLDALYEDVRLGSPSVAAVFGVRFVVSDMALEHRAFRRLGQLGPGTIYENREAVPRFYIASAARRVSGPDEAIRILRTGQIDPRTTVLVEGGGSDDVAPRPEVSGSVTVKTLETARVELAVTAERPVWLVVNDSFYPGVSALVDGRPMPVLRANGHVRAVSVPAGKHHVEMFIASTSVWRGLAVSCVSLVVGVGVSAFSILRAHSVRVRQSLDSTRGSEVQP